MLIDETGHAYRGYVTELQEAKAVVVSPDEVVSEIMCGVAGLERYLDGIFGKKRGMPAMEDVDAVRIQRSPREQMSRPCRLWIYSSPSGSSVLSHLRSGCLPIGVSLSLLSMNRAPKCAMSSASHDTGSRLNAEKRF